jgi:plasmid stability protein
VPATPLAAIGSAIVASNASNGRVVALAAVSIRNLDERVKERLRIRAARHGRSMEAEIRAILTDAVSGPSEAAGFFDVILDRFGELGGVELDIPPRTDRARAADLR